MNSLTPQEQAQLAERLRTWANMAWLLSYYASKANDQSIALEGSEAYLEMIRWAEKLES